LEDVVEFLDTIRKPLEGAKRTPGPYPYYGASGIVDYVDGYLFDEELVLLSEDGANITDRNYPVCFLASGKYWVNNHAHVLRTKDGNENKFICNSLERKDYKQYNSGMAMPKLNQEVCRSIPINCPSFDEQKKIGAYLNNLDNLITLHQRKSFSKNRKKIVWEQRKLEEIVERVTRKNQDLVSELPLTISAQYGLIDQNEFFDKRVASKDVSGYYLIYNGEFAYNKSTSTDAPWGAIKRLDKYENGVLSTLYIVFKIRNEEEVNSDFLVTYYDTSNWHKDIQAIAAEGARNHGLLNIAPADFFKTELMMPQDIDEQKKIGDYFKSLNDLITLHRRAYHHKKRRTYK
jgi:type I restriction enzyme S subunit